MERRRWTSERFRRKTRQELITEWNAGVRGWWSSRMCVQGAGLVIKPAVMLAINRD